MGSSSTLTSMGWISTTTPSCHNRHLMHLCSRNASTRLLYGRRFYSRLRCTNNKDNNGLWKIFHRPQIKQNDIQSKSFASTGVLMESNEELDSSSWDSSMVTTSVWNWQGYDIRYQFAGSDGPALVLIHGFGANSDHWRKNLPFLAKSHRVYAIDLLGYGYSDKPNPLDFPVNSLYTFDTWAKQVNDFCLDVVKDRAYFICNSIGGVVGLEAAIKERNVCRGLVLLNISLRMLHIKKQSWYQRPFVKSFQDLLRNTDLGKMFYKAVATPKAVKNILRQCYYNDSAVTDELVEKILLPGLQPGAVDVFLTFICYSEGPLPEELIPKVECPLLVVWGDKDPWEPIELGRAYGNFKNVEDFIVLPNVGHCPQDEAPHLVNPLVEAFVARHATD